MNTLRWLVGSVSAMFLLAWILSAMYHAQRGRMEGTGTLALQAGLGMASIAASVVGVLWAIGVIR